MSSAVQAYLTQTSPDQVDSAMVAYLANLDTVAGVYPEIAQSIVQELADQRSYLKLVASENFCSLPTQCAMANLMTDKYAEGYPEHRFYAGCANVDAVENAAREEAKRLFGCDHAYVQPHSGADANMVALWAIVRQRVQLPQLDAMGAKDPTALSREDWHSLREIMGNQKLLGMDLFCGGHLTHGYRHNITSQMFDTYHYGVSRETGLIDEDNVAAMLRELRPLVFLVGYSAYPRAINFARMRELADSVGAVLMVDMAHFAGLVAGGAFEGDYNPVPFAHVVTTTTHKTLRGPRGGMVLCTQEFAESVDKGCPMVLGGPLPHVSAAKAVALREANQPEFRQYAANVVANARALAEACKSLGMNVVTGGTDNHMLLVNISSFGITGRQAESVLRECGVTLNRNALPNDPNGAWYTSGLRIGTPAVTTLGMGPRQMAEIADIMHTVLKNTTPAMAASGKSSKSKYQIDDAVRQEVHARVRALLAEHMLYPQLDLDQLRACVAQQGAPA